MSTSLTRTDPPRRRAFRQVDVFASEACRGKPPPIMLKVAPDLEPSDIDAIARIALDKRLGALIVSNTTITRPPLRSPLAGEAGKRWSGVAPA